MRARAGIMRAVDDGALVPFLKTSRPFDRRKSAHNRFFAELDVRGAESRRLLLRHSVFGIRHAKLLATRGKSHLRIALANRIQQLARE